MSRGDYADAYAKCPFYAEQGMLYVSCEGFTPHDSLTIHFKRNREKAVWITRHCNRIKGCHKCPLWVALWNEWERTHPDGRTIDNDEVQPMPGRDRNDDSI